MRCVRDLANHKHKLWDIRSQQSSKTDQYVVNSIRVLSDLLQDARGITNNPRNFKECTILCHENSGPHIAHEEQRGISIISCTSAFFRTLGNGLKEIQPHANEEDVFCLFNLLQNSGNYMYHLP